MKFYYNGQLVRTSKTHHYTHGVLSPEGQVVSCCSRLDLAEKEARRYASETEKSLEHERMMLAAINAGKKAIRIKERNYSYVINFEKEGYTAEKIEKFIENDTKRLERNRKYSVVELEER